MRWGPNIINLSPEWLASLGENQAGLPDGRYVPARSIGFQSLGATLRATWLVLAGRADALLWPGQ